MNWRGKRLSFGLLGNLVEWYEFGVYGYLASEIGQAFFESTHPLVQLGASFAVFASGFLMRPLGAIVFGYIGDRFGRVPALSNSIVLMAICTLGIGLLPDYQQIGVLAPLTLVVLRLAQGLSVGGEYGGSITYLFESATGDRPAMWSSFAVASTIAGLLTGSTVSATVSVVFEPSEVVAWAWRLPFILGGILGFTVYSFRRFGSDHSPPPMLPQPAVRNPVTTALVTQWRVIFLMMGILCLQAVAFYIVFVTLPGAFHEGARGSRLLANSAAMFLMCLLIPLFARLADRLGVIAVQAIAAFCYAVVAAPLLAMAQEGVALAAAAQLILATIHAALVAPTPAMLSSGFPKSVRYTSVAISYNLGISIFGGTSPLLLVYLMTLSDSWPWPTIMLVVASMITLCGLWVETRRRATRDA